MNKSYVRAKIVSNIQVQGSSEVGSVSSGDYEQVVAMVYRNEHNEVSYYANDAEAKGLDNGLSSIALIFVLSFVALVTIARRPAAKL